MLIAKKIHVSLFENTAVVYSPTTGQTHKLDDSCYHILQQLSESTPISFEQLLSVFTQSCNEEEKKQISTYTENIINELSTKELISIIT